MQRDKRELLASEIKLARANNKWTQQELARVCKISNATIVSIENNTRKASTSTIIKLCGVLGISNKKMKTFL